MKSANHFVLAAFVFRINMYGSVCSDLLHPRQYQGNLEKSLYLWKNNVYLITPIKHLFLMYNMLEISFTLSQLTPFDWPYTRLTMTNSQNSCLRIFSGVLKLKTAFSRQLHLALLLSVLANPRLCIYHTNPFLPIFLLPSFLSVKYHNL